MTTIAIIPATEDSVYQAALATFDRVRMLSAFYPSFDANTPLGSALANLGNHLAVARGDATLGGTPISEATRARILDADGQLRPEYRSQIAGWAAMLNAAYPAATVTLPIIQPAPPPGMTQAPGILDGELFGINKKLLLVGVVAAYFLFSEK